MPQLVLFKRSWSIGSDDFVFPGIVDAIIRSIWFILVVCFYAKWGNDLDSTCRESVHLHVYFIGLIVFLIVTTLLECAIVHVSRKGTIANSMARQKLPILLYARVVVAIPEVGWNAYGTWGVFSGATSCHRKVVDLAKGTVIAGWVVLLIAIITCLVLFNLYSGKNKKRAKTRVRSFRRGSRRPFNQQKQWEKRCKCMFMCADGQDNTSVFSTLAELSADYFKGVDLVPSDVIAGLILLSRKQERKRQQLRLFVTDESGEKRYKNVPSEDTVDAPDVISVCLKNAQPWMTLEAMSHYLKFAIGSYGWPFYLTLTNPVLGVCSLCTACRCCSCRDDQGSVFMDNCCLCNTAAFEKTTGIPHDDVIYACFKNGIYEIPFYVVLDREKNAVVIAVRGTLSMQDVITDLVIERGFLDIPGIECARAHNGILQSAIYIQKTLEEKNILQKAFSELANADLVVTGHSLGAGVSAMLAILLKPQYPQLHCFSFSPPGELVSPEVCSYAEDVVCSVVLGDDIITRQGMLMMDDLKIQILKAIHETNLPKYKILSSGCWRMCCGRAGILGEDVEYGQTDDQTDAAQTNNGNSNYLNRSSVETSLTECMANSQHIKTSYRPLHIPGQILHIEQSHQSGDDDYEAAWKVPENFTEIIVSPDMLAHHFPDALLEAIDSLIDRKYIVQDKTKPEVKLDTRIAVDV